MNSKHIVLFKQYFSYELNKCLALYNLIIFMIQNNSLKSARPLNFKCNPTNTQLVNFVNPSYSQAVSVNMPTLQAKTVPNFYPQTSLYDRYNRNNLYFRDCERRDIIPLTKNIVIHQEQLSENMALEIARKAQKNKTKQTNNQKVDQKLNRTQKVFTKSGGKQSASREYIQNQIMFNYKEMEEHKRKQKKEYLSQVERKIAEAEQVIKDLAVLQSEEKKEIDDINTFYKTEQNKAKRKIEEKKNNEDIKIKTRFQEAKEFMRQLQENQDFLSTKTKK